MITCQACTPPGSHGRPSAQPTRPRHGYIHNSNIMWQDGQVATYLCRSAHETPLSGSKTRPLLYWSIAHRPGRHHRKFWAPPVWLRESPAVHAANRPHLPLLLQAPSYGGFSSAEEFRKGRCTDGWQKLGTGIRDSQFRAGDRTCSPISDGECVVMTNRA